MRVFVIALAACLATLTVTGSATARRLVGYRREGLPPSPARFSAKR